MTIPVYLYRQEEFDKRFDNRYILPHLNTHSPSDLKESLKQIYYPKNVWRFNQVVGYVILSIEKYSEDHYDIAIEKWYLRSKRITLATRKDRMAPVSNIGDHFTISNWSVGSITSTIKMYIENDNLYKNHYIDYSLLETFMGVVDLEKLRKEVGVI